MKQGEYWVFFSGVGNGVCVVMPNTFSKISVLTMKSSNGTEKPANIKESVMRLQLM